jgi:hypothetical protein
MSGGPISNRYDPHLMLRPRIVRAFSNGQKNVRAIAI